MKSFLYGSLVVVLTLISVVFFIAIPTSAINTFSCISVTEIPQVECEALVALYNSTNGPGWTNNTNWLVTNTPSDWYGVTVTSGHVFNIYLSWNTLIGNIPAELGNLTNLVSMYLEYNGLSGSIPNELGNLTNLTDLYLDSNHLSGSIPVELGNLTNLTDLFLEWNQLSGSIPVELGNLTHLTQMDLSGNQINGNIPPELGNLTNLVSLSLEYNQLNGSIPAELGNLTYLTHMDLSSNQINGNIPPELGNLTHLTQMDLSGNQINGNIPPELGNLINLKSLLINGNQLIGNIPGQLGNLTQLESFDLGQNQLSGIIPPELGNLVNLTWLVLDYNQLIGNIPVQLGNLTQLESLSLRNNQLSGNIPPELGNLVNLTWLALDYNQLIGNIPVQLGNLTQLQYLILDNNQLSGNIPQELGNLINLISLTLRYNQLSGNIPPELGNLIKLKDLYLDYNQLSGNMPAELGNLTALDYLVISSNNNLDGSLPNTLINLNLTWLWFDNTNLCEPYDPAFQAWLNSIPSLKRTGVLCSGTGYSISGRVVDDKNNPITGITISDGTGHSATTDSNGYYNMSELGGFYSFTPTKDGLFFTPPTRDIFVSEDNEVNFTGYPCIAPSELNVCGLQPGDILLSRSPSYAAPFSIGGTYFTHAAMYLGEVAAPGGGPETVMPRLAEGQGYTAIVQDQVWETNLMSRPFWSGKNLLDWAVIRPKANDTVKNDVIQTIRNIAADENVTFDISAPKWTTDKFYCSKLVWYSYLAGGGIDLEVNMGIGSTLLDWWVTPDDLFFSVIKGSTNVESKLGITVDRILLTLWSPAHIMLVDPSGLRTGYDPVTDTILNDIPFATYTAPPDAEVETISAIGVGDGWKVVVTGYDDGEYKLEYRYLEAGTLDIVKTNNTEPGQVEEYDIEDPMFGIFLPLIKR